MYIVLTPSIILGECMALRGEREQACLYIGRG